MSVIPRVKLHRARGQDLKALLLQDALLVLCVRSPEHGNFCSGAGDGQFAFDAGGCGAAEEVEDFGGERFLFFVGVFVCLF